VVNFSGKNAIFRKKWKKKYGMKGIFFKLLKIPILLSKTQQNFFSIVEAIALSPIKKV
jgi:hypothetical protein